MRAAFHLLYRELLVSGVRKGRLERNASLHVTSVMEIHFVVILSLLLVATAPISLMMRLINEKQISKGGGIFTTYSS